MHPLHDYTLVFVGCGGTFFYGVPYYSTWMRRSGNHHPPVLIDPDIIEESDQTRQWPTVLAGQSKVMAAECMLGLTCVKSELNVCDSEGLFPPTRGPLLVVVNVDNNSARLDVRRWLSERSEEGIMVVSGCERNHGQAYYGIWTGLEWEHDWYEYHADVGETAQRTNPCGLQTARANMLTAACSSSCLEDLLTMQQEPEGTPGSATATEYYWSLDNPNLMSIVRVSKTCLLKVEKATRRAK